MFLICILICAEILQLYQVVGKKLRFIYVSLVVIITSIFIHKGWSISYIICLMYIKYWASNIINNNEHLRINIVLFYHIICNFTIIYFIYADMHFLSIYVFLFMEIASIILHYYEFYITMNFTYYPYIYIKTLV